MNSIYSALITSPFTQITSPFTQPLVLLHLLILTQCAIKFVDYQLTKKHLEKLG